MWGGSAESAHPPPPLGEIMAPDECFVYIIYDVFTLNVCLLAGSRDGSICTMKSAAPWGRVRWITPSAARRCTSADACLPNLSNPGYLGSEAMKGETKPIHC